MSPTLADGDYILIKTKPRRLRPGFIYVVAHERLGRIVKRLDTVDEKGCQFSGDNSGSTETSRIGIVPDTAILGRAILAITPKGLRRI